MNLEKPGIAQFFVNTLQGSIDNRLDFNLLTYLFRRFADAQFVFVGRITENSLQQRLKNFPNVYCAGPQSPETLPGWVQQMDLCLIPFVKNRFTAGIYPLKANEYLAAGKPVVSTAFADLHDFQGLISIADGWDPFAEAVEASLNSNDGQAAARKAFAAGNSWENRAALLERVLTCHFSI